MAEELEEELADYEEEPAAEAAADSTDT